MVQFGITFAIKASRAAAWVSGAFLLIVGVACLARRVQSAPFKIIRRRAAKARG